MQIVQKTNGRSMKRGLLPSALLLVCTLTFAQSKVSGTVPSSRISTMVHPVVGYGGRFENGKPWSGYRVSHQQILKGGVLHSEMKAKEK